MPKIRKGESKKEYISRATTDMIKREHLKPDHARAKSEGMWRQHLKDKK